MKYNNRIYKYHYNKIHFIIILFTVVHRMKERFVIRIMYVLVLDTSSCNCDMCIELLNIHKGLDARYTKHHLPSQSSLKFVRQFLNSTLFSAPPFQYTGKSGRAMCTERRAGLAKLLPPSPTGGGKKCCRRVSG